QEAFCELQFQILGCESGFVQHALDELAESLLPKLQRRYIDRDRHCGDPFVLPFASFRTRGPEDPLTDWNDEAAIFSHANELIGRYQAQLGLTPADQRLYTDNLSADDFHLRLINEEQFFFLKRHAQTVFQGESLDHLGVHIVCEKTKRVTAAFLRTVHRSIGIADE